MRIFFIALALVLCVAVCNAQVVYVTGPPPPRRVLVPENNKMNASGMVLGGSLSFGYGSNYSTFGVSPQIGYSFGKYITIGAGASYNYYNYFNRKENSYQNYFGPNAYIRFSPIWFTVFQIQPEVYRMWGAGYDSRTVTTLVLGVGSQYPMGPGCFTAMVNYDAIQNYWSPYGRYPFLSLGYIYKF